MNIFSAVLLGSYVFKLSDDKKAVDHRTMLNLYIDGGLHVRVFWRHGSQLSISYRGNRCLVGFHCISLHVGNQPTLSVKLDNHQVMHTDCLFSLNSFARPATSDSL